MTSMGSWLSSCFRAHVTAVLSPLPPRPARRLSSPLPAAGPVQTCVLGQWTQPGPAA